FLCNLPARLLYNRPGFWLAPVVRKVPGNPVSTTMMHIYVPLGIYLPKGLGLQIDDKLIGNTPFWSCIPFQCEARVTLPPELIDQLGKGQRALYAVYENPTKGTVLPISLDGFAEGLAALKPFVPDAGSSLDAPAPGN
ncbi:MAG: invasion associated locus B family protein, partial [Hyphomicrobiales bacterium]